MKIIDFFFTKILSIQFFLDKIEKRYLKMRQYLLWVIIPIIVFGIILILCRQEIWGTIVFISGILFLGFNNIVGWKYSVRKWLKICVIYNLVFSAILACIVQDIIQHAIIIPLFIVAYLIVWLFLSLISYSKVSLLVNEILSGITATIFTIGTYLIGMSLKNMPSSNDFLLYFRTDEAFMQALENRDLFAWSFLGVDALEMLESAFMSLLPIIGVTALSIIMVKTKVYWMEKNDRFEPETKTNQKDEQIMRTVQEYLKDTFKCTDDNLNGNATIFTIDNQMVQPYIKILTYRKCVVVSTSIDMYKMVKEQLSEKNRDEIFEFPLVYGQTIHYIPDINMVSEPQLPKEYSYELLQGEEISKLAYIQGFDNSLVFDDKGNTSTKIVYIAKKDNVVVGIAGAGAVTDKMWEVGIDVRSECRNNGLGSVLTKKLTLAILKKGIIPFYSASVTNIGSQMVASRAGYIPCWIDTFGTIFDKYYAYDSEDVIKFLQML